MAKEVKCPWCDKNVTVIEKIYQNQYGEVKERRCSQCNGIIAAYLVEREQILKEIRIVID